MMKVQVLSRRHRVPRRHRGDPTVQQRITTLVASGFLAFASPAMAGPLEDAHAAYERGDYATAMSLWRPLADQGDTVAERNLGLMYFRGQVVPQNYAQAFAWWRVAAAQGDTGARRNLGLMYIHGQGVPQSFVEALAWLQPAANQGDAIAQYSLGLMYTNGQGVPQDYVQAHVWLNLAASGASDAELRDLAVKARDEAAAAMTPAQIAKAQRLASDWTPK